MPGKTEVPRTRIDNEGRFSEDVGGKAARRQCGKAARRQCGKMSERRQDERAEDGGLSMSERVMVRSGLFTDGESPALLGSRCTVCGAHHFPRHDTCPYCSTEDPVPTELSGSGTLWAWTAVTSAPPGYQGEIPYGLGVVELPEGIRVITRLTEGDPAALSFGQPMGLRIVALHTDADGNDVVTFAFAPLDAA